jgi:hypothetical protein
MALRCLLWAAAAAIPLHPRQSPFPCRSRLCGRFGCFSAFKMAQDKAENRARRSRDAWRMLCGLKYNNRNKTHMGNCCSVYPIGWWVC